ncbi:MAG: putative zinc-binding metallopeptidase [Pseudobacter sp.]|uniref:putative zinc-binding metallopeptidase n=1 Tax=Pseudobacter sp. TaxID=2045420 RepID=UPI003F7EFCCC
MKLNFYIVCVFVLLVSSCKKEEKLQPSEESQGYVLPQGNNDFDKTIGQYFDKYGSYLLYKFSDRDAYWTPSGWKNTRYNEATKAWTTGFLVKPAEEPFIAKQLNLIQACWFDYYSDEFLKTFLPAKILLCAAVDSSSLKYDFSTTPTTVTVINKPVGAWFNLDNISVNYGSVAVENMTALDSGTFIYKVNNMFMRNIFGRKPIEPPADFVKVTSYATNFTTQPAAYDAGAITNYYGSGPVQDWEEYILAMTGYPESVLNTSAPNTTKSFVGILNPTKDRFGKIRQRYNIVRNYFIEKYNIDLQQIGNASISR